MPHSHGAAEGSLLSHCHWRLAVSIAYSSAMTSHHGGQRYRVHILPALDLKPGRQEVCLAASGLVPAGSNVGVSALLNCLWSTQSIHEFSLEGPVTSRHLPVGQVPGSWGPRTFDPTRPCPPRLALCVRIFLTARMAKKRPVRGS